MLLQCSIHTTQQSLDNNEAYVQVGESVVNGAEWLGGNSQQVTGDSGLIWDYSLNNKFEVEESNRREADRLSE